MSFLNPVNEPVLRFSSTDAGAPQINYAARVAGDIKAVLKSCLVTGYGTTASAGWTAVNEVGNIIEFVSPIAAMSDYRFGVDDATQARTTWYYQYQDVARVVSGGVVERDFYTTVDKSNVQNGWDLLVTNRGFIFIERCYYTLVENLSARVTYFMPSKSALLNDDIENIVFLSMGQSAYFNQFQKLFDKRLPFASIEPTGKTVQLFGATLQNNTTTHSFDTSVVSLSTPFFIASNAPQNLLAQIPAVIFVVPATKSEVYGISDVEFNGRPALKLPFSGNAPSMTYIDNAYRYAAVLIIYLDYWEY